MKMLVVSLSGIGNTILATPLLGALRRRYPEARIDLLVWTPAAGAPVRGSGLVSEIMAVPRGWRRRLNLLRQLRAVRYDAVLTVFPSNKAGFHLLAFLTGAKMRVAHSYRGGWRRGEWLLTNRIAARPDWHDVDQNLALLDVFSPGPDKPDLTPVFHLEAADRAWADSWIQARGLTGKRLVGIHPGAGAGVTLQHWQGIAKRWPRDRFADVARRLGATPDCAILLVGGPEETELKQAVRQAAGGADHIHIVDATLPQTAAILSRCELMISNDSGLMHVAAAVGVPVLALFGPTQTSRTAPLGRGHRVLCKAVDCRPCLKYPFATASSKIRCRCGGTCLAGIDVDDVLATAIDMLRRV